MKVVFYGTSEGQCPYYRARMYEPTWNELGIETRWIDRLPVLSENGQPIGLDGSGFEDADVIVLRRYYSVEQPANGQADWITDSVVPWLAAKKNVGIIWDVDDDLFSVERSNGYRDEIVAQREQIRTLAQMADLVTVSTPHVASIYGHLSTNPPRVIRNAIDLAAYSPRRPGPAEPPSGRPVVAYFGMGARMLDMLGARGYPAQAVAEQRRRTRTVFLGVRHDRSELGPLAGLWHDVIPYVPMEEWASTLSAVGADVGLAPLEGTRFDLGRSELHWLEWTAVGAATIASRLPGGPYGVARDVAILARGAREWSDGLRRLVDSAGLRAELVGRSMELAQAMYDPRQRALEWIDAFGWAIEHAGSGARSVAA